MPNHDADQAKPTKEQADLAFAERIKAIQERARQEGFVSGGSDDKPMMDEAWGEDSDDIDRHDLEALRAAIEAGLNSGSAIRADQVFAELRARNVAKS